MNQNMDQLVSIAMGCFIYLIVLLGITLHVLGIYCMHKNKDFGKIQRVVLTNLSAAKLVSLPGFIADVFFKCINPPAPVGYEIFVKYFGFITLLLALFSMSLISMDRLLCVTLCLQYRRIVTKKRIIKTILISWFLAIALSSLEILPQPIAKYILKFIGCCFFILTIVTYTTIAYKLKKRSREFASISNSIEPVRKTCRRHYVIPFLIVMSFILFGVIPFDLNLFLTPSHELDVARYTILSLYIALDPIIYVFLQKDLRGTALMVLSSFSCCIRTPVDIHDCSSPRQTYSSRDELQEKQRPYMVKCTTVESIVESEP